LFEGPFDSHTERERERESMGRPPSNGGPAFRFMQYEVFSSSANLIFLICDSGLYVRVWEPIYACIFVLCIYGLIQAK